MSARVKVLRLLGAALVVLAVVPWLGTSTATADETIHVKSGSINDHQCDPTEWHFVITGIEMRRPHPPRFMSPSLTVLWTSRSISSRAIPRTTPWSGST